jgi:glycosyltransferase involved in cell wall biosynthesis
MKVVTVVRTLNESANVERFCYCYRDIADEILIADGGSSDDTIEKASKIPKVSVRPFEEKVIHKDGITWSNPRGKHCNFLFDWALERGADWIIFDDCDCVPTVALQEHGRTILEECKENMVFAFRMFVKYDTHWYPSMNYAGQSLWAWRRFVNVRADEKLPAYFTMLIPESPTSRLIHPFALLHYFYPDEETIRKKLDFYLITEDLGAGVVPNHPSSFMGREELLPEWAKWREDDQV